MMEQSTKQQPASRDYGFLAIVTLVIINAVWLLLMPVVPAIATATLLRFQLQTASFPVWAIQQPIPSMYNFANRYEIREYPRGLVDPIVDDTRKRYANHFPTRVITFADARFKHLREGKDRWFTFDSSYRGQTIESHFYAKAIEGGGFQLIRLAPNDDPAEASR